MGTGGMLGVGLVSVLAGVALTCLELFVAFLQAYLFTFLTTLFISQMVTHHDHGHDDHGHGDHGHGAHGHGAHATPTVVGHAKAH